MLFSIVVPVYNVEQFLDRCVQSLIHQTFEEIEIILVDDGSTDASGALCDEYAKQDNRITVIHKTNGGLSDARNSGLGIATGKYIIFVDSDDYIELDTCEKFLPYIDQNIDVLIGDATVENGHSQLKHNINLKGNVVSGRQYLNQALQSKCAPMAACLNIYRREFLQEQKLEFKFGILHEDEEFTPKCFLQAKTVLYTGNKFYCYIIREGSITKKQDKSKNAIDLIETCLSLEKLFKNEEKKLRKLLLNSLVEKYLSAFFMGDMYRYKKQYVYKKFAIRNALFLKTKLKAILFAISPKIYCKINSLLKKGK